MMKYLSKLPNTVEKNKSISFLIAFVLMIITALAMRPSSNCLITDSTPLGIVDLELAYDQLRAASIKSRWSENDCDNLLTLDSTSASAAVVNILLDFPFIVAYTWFFIVAVILTKSANRLKTPKVTLILVYAAILAGVLDVIENGFMLAFLMDKQVSSYTFAIPATAKFALLLVLAGAILIRSGLKLILRRKT